MPHHPLAAARRHWPLSAVLAAAITLRVLFLVAYPYAFFFQDSRSYVSAAALGHPSFVRPYGYSLLLKPFVGHPYITVAVLQHLAGLLVIAAGYAFLVRRGARPWVAALAVLPFALDARVPTLEHYVLAETAYLTATALGLFLLAGRDTLRWADALAAGALLGFAAATRTVGLPLLGLVLVYLLVSRARWTSLVAFALPVVALLGGYLIWYHNIFGPYAFGEYQGRFLYSRVMPIADCDKLKLTAEQRTLCMPDAPAAWRARPDQYIWNAKSPAHSLYPAKRYDKFLGDFAGTVIKQRPGPFLAMIAEQSWWHLEWQSPISDRTDCTSLAWLPPESPGINCEPRYYLPTGDPEAVPGPTAIVDNPLSRVLHAYGQVVKTPGPLYLAGVIIALFAAVWRPRRRPWREAADGLLFAGGGLGLLVISVATSMFDYRYAEPAILLIPIGLALAATRIHAVATTPAPLPQESDSTWPSTSLKSPSSSPA